VYFTDDDIWITNTETRAMGKLFIDTTEYEFTWGRKPRGAGGWVFRLLGPDIEEERTLHARTFGEALKAAKMHAREIGAEVVEVMPCGRRR
jgi:hypothetical protein